MVEEFLKTREEGRQAHRAYIASAWGNVVGEAERKMDDSLDDRFDAQDQNKLIKATIDMNRLSNVPVEIVQIKQRIDQLDVVLKKLDDPTLDTVARLSLIDSVDAETALRVGQMLGQSGSNASPAAEDAAPGATPEAVVVPSVASPQNWQDLDLAQRRVEHLIAEASRIYLPGNKKMVVLTKQLDGIRRELDLDYESARSRLDLERQSLVDQEQDLEQKLPEYAGNQPEIRKAPARQPVAPAGPGRVPVDLHYRGEIYQRAGLHRG